MSNVSAELETPETRQFDEFVETEGKRLQRTLVAAHGMTVGVEATQAALVYCWEHWSRVAEMENPTGYLVRVGQNAAKREYRLRPVPKTIDLVAPKDFEPGLDDALLQLTEQQRIAVTLVHGHGYPLAEVAAALDVSISTVRNHLRRGTEKLRQQLGVNNEPVQ